MQLQSVPGDPGEEAANRLAAQGVVLVTGPLDDERVSTAAVRVLGVALDEPERPITVHLTNVSGSIAAALALHDILERSATPIHAVAAGMLTTAGAIVLQAAAPGERVLLPSTRIHLTRVDTPSFTDIDVESAAADVRALRGHAESILGLSLDRAQSFSAADAVAAGLADRVGAAPPR